MIASRVVHVSGPAEVQTRPATALLARQVLRVLHAQQGGSADIVIVRRITVRLREPDVLTANRPAARWQVRPLRERRVYRPAHELVPPSAGAVGFSDLPELLSCLLRDLCGGVAAERWWWPLALDAYGGRPDGGTVAAILAEQPALLASSLQRLAAEGLGAQALSLLTPRPSSRVEAPAMRLTAHVHGAVNEPGLAGTEAQDPAPPGFAATRTQRLPRDRAARATSIDSPGPRRADSGVASAAHPEQDMHLVQHNDRPAQVARPSLVVRPPHARGNTAGGAPACAERRPKQTRDGASHGLAASLLPKPTGASRSARATASPQPPGQAAFGEPESSLARPTATTPMSEVRTPRADLHQPAAGAAWRVARPDRAATRHPVVHRLAPCGGITVQDLHPVQASALASPTTPDAKAVPLALLRSPHASLAYLLNAAIACGLYRDFSAAIDIPGEGNALPVSPWAFLGKAGNTLLRPQRLDPALQALLTELDHEHRLARADEAGLRAHRQRPWLRRTLPPLTQRLHQALGTRTRAELASLLFHPGTLVLSPGHLDVHLSLERLPIEVRLAGLDRNPGFIPAANRIVEFHYA